MTVAVSAAKARGAEIVICASTGNTSAAAAKAYAARGKMGKCIVLLPHGKIALGKLAQAAHMRATTCAVGNFDAALRIVRELGATGKVEVVNSINPLRIEGQKTAAFEICNQLG